MALINLLGSARGDHRPLSPHLLALRLPLILLIAFHVTAALAFSPWRSTQCPNEPGRRLHAAVESKECPVPGRIGIVSGGDGSGGANEDNDNVMTWTLRPRCIDPWYKQINTSSVDCLFTSTEFRNGHGISLVTSTEVVSHLIGLEAFVDKPAPQPRSSPAEDDGAAAGPAYEIVPVEGKGMGVVATRRIRKDEIFMVDVPAMLISLNFLTSTKPHHRRIILEQALSQLPPETRDRAYALSRGSAPYEVDSIMGPNANSILVTGEVHFGLFTEVARINHDCRPNAYYRFSERRLTMEVVAFRDIEPGEEISMSYVPLEMHMGERREYLKNNWEFDCACSLCRSPQEDIDNTTKWRDKVRSLRETVKNARSEGFQENAIAMAEEWLMVSEWDKTPPLMAEYHHTLADLYFLKGDMANATMYARMAMDEWLRLGSVDDEQLEQSRLFLRRLEN
ncbi:hypothetical protein VTH06DRAFT_4195 [Thermothelomyces fergusii]